VNQPPPPPVAALIANPARAPYFSVSLLKFGVLSTLTFGLYDLYWAWQNWKLIKERAEPKIMPFWRAFFGFIWIYPLLRNVRDTLTSTQPAGEKPTPFPAGVLSIAWIVLTLLYKLPGVFFFLSLTSVIPLLIAQSRINQLNAALAPQAPVNSRFTWANWIWIVIGAIWLALAIYGSLLPDNE
jgi:hypothetical protein